MDRNFRITSPHLLAVEGKDEYNFFTAILNDLSINTVQLVDLGGKDKFPIELPLLMQLEGFRNLKVIGFVRDAEEKRAKSAFDSIRATLKKNRLPAPASMASFTPGPPKTGIFIMPDNRGAGMLENLCLRTLKGQPIDRCINDFMSCISAIMNSEEQAYFNESKARVQTYLAFRAPLVNSLGLGALKRYWDFNHPCFEKLKQFLRNLFIED